jgi:hypothetical protein
LRTCEFSQRLTRIIASGQFAIYKVMAFASSSDVTRQLFHVEDRPDRSCAGARVTDVWQTRDFPETFRLRGRVALLAIDG